MTRTGAATSRAGIPGAGFSVRQYAGSARGSHRADLKVESYATTPLDASTLELLDTLGALEHSALGYLRSVLVTPTHDDARMTAFLVTWAYEKYWLGDALETIVGAHPGYRRPEPGRSTAERLRRGLHDLGERIEPIRESVVANLIGEDVIAVHAITAAVDEWIQQAAYRRLAEQAGDTQLGRTLTALLAVKQRHEEFFAGQARDRLSGSTSAARLARRRLRRTALPLGSPDVAPGPLGRLLGGLVTAADLAAVDRRLDAYPGLAGLRLAERAAGRAVRRAGRTAAPVPPPSKETRQP